MQNYGRMSRANVFAVQDVGEMGLPGHPRSAAMITAAEEPTSQGRE